MRLSSHVMIPLSPIGDSDESGVIINTASVAAFEGQIGQTAYSASKGGYRQPHSYLQLAN